MKENSQSNSYRKPLMNKGLKDIVLNSKLTGGFQN